MPRLKKTEAQRRAERFDEHYRVGKARLKLHEPDIAAAIGLKPSTLRKYKQQPDLFRIGQFARLGHVFDWSGDVYQDIFGAQKVKGVPRLKKTEAQRRAERFDEHYRVGKARLKLHEPEIAAALGLGESTLRKYKRDPDLFSIGQFARLGRVFEWSGDVYQDIFGTQK